MDVRRVGLGVAAAGTVTQVIGFGIDGRLHAADPDLASREGILTLSNLGHLLVFLGLSAIVVGIVASLIGPRLYRPARPSQTGRRLAQLSAPVAAMALIGGLGVGANASSLGAVHNHDHGAVTAADVHVPGDHDHVAAHADHANDGSMDHDNGAMDHGHSSDEVASGDHAEGDHDAGAMDHAHGDSVVLTGDTSSSSGSSTHGHGHSSSGSDHDNAAGHSNDSGDHANDQGGDHDNGDDHTTDHDNGDDHNDHDHGTTDTTAGGSHDHDHGSTTTTPGSTDTTQPHEHDHGSSTTTTPGGTGTTVPHDHDHPGEGCKNGAHDHGHLPPVALDADTQIAQDLQLAEAKVYAEQYPTAAAAMQDGYVQVTHYLCGIGAHYMKLSWVDETFNPSQPEILLYDDDGPLANLVGVNYYVGSSSGVAPAGFAGTNDQWHQHVGLCLKGFFVVLGEDSTEEECTAAGGVKQADGGYYWLLHAWIVDGYEMPTDWFSPTNPVLPPGPWDLPGGV